jgi:hypothetical protein
MSAIPEEIRAAAFAPGLTKPHTHCSYHRGCFSHCLIDLGRDCLLGL